VVFERRQGDSGIADRGVQLMRDARHQFAQCRQLFRPDQFVLRNAERFQCLLELAVGTLQCRGPRHDQQFQLLVHAVEFTLHLAHFGDVDIHKNHLALQLSGDGWGGEV
jgi:hypothetical protein